MATKRKTVSSKKTTTKSSKNSKVKIQSKRNRYLPFIVVAIVVIVGSALLFKSFAASSGSLDTSFNTTGVVRTSFTGASGTVQNVFIDPTSGKTVATGLANVISSQSNTYFSAFTRYNQDGSLDTTYGTSGKLVTNFSNSAAKSGAIADSAIDSKGRIVTVGDNAQNSKCSHFTSRITQTGAVDVTFGSKGLITSPCNQTSYVGNQVAVDSSDRIYVLRDNKVTRYVNNGTVDPSYVSAIPANIQSLDMRVDGQGSLFVVGIINNNTATSTDSSTAVAKLLSNGSLDTSYGAQGVVNYQINATQYEYPRSMAIDKDGRVLFSGGGVYYNAAGNTEFGGIVRLTTAGVPDSTFGTNGMISLTQSMPVIATDAQNNVLLVGRTNCTNPTNGFFAATNLKCSYAVNKYDVNGVQDMNYGTNGLTTVFVDPGFDRAADALVTADNKLLFGGTSGGGLAGDPTGYFNLVRLNP